MTSHVPMGISQTLRKWMQMWDPTLMENIKILGITDVSMSDRRVVELVRRLMMSPSPYPSVKLSGPAMKSPQVEVVLNLLNGKVNDIGL